jgi:hypothetical protein
MNPPFLVTRIITVFEDSEKSRQQISRSQTILNHVRGGYHKKESAFPQDIHWTHCDYLEAASEPSL